MRTYNEQNTVVASIVEKLLKSVALRLVGTAIYISTVIRDSCLRELCVLDYYSKDLSRSCTGRSEQSSVSGSDPGVEERTVPLDLFSLVEIRIYKRSFASQGKALVKLEEIHLETAEWAASFEKNATEEEVVTDVSNSGAWKALLRKFLSDTCNAR